MVAVPSVTVPPCGFAKAGKGMEPVRTMPRTSRNPMSQAAQNRRHPERTRWRLRCPEDVRVVLVLSIT